MPEARFYKDIDLSFRLNADTGDIGVLTDVDAVRNSLRNLVLTQKGEALFNILKGTNLRKLLFSPINAPIIFRIENEIRFVINNFEPRVRNVRVQVFTQEEQHLVSAKIWFQVYGSDRINVMPLSLITLR